MHTDRPTATDTPKKGVILLAGINGPLRAMNAAMLEKQGYAVYPVSNCRQAISIAGRSARVDLLLADAALPEMTGAQLAQWLSALHSQMEVLITATAAEGKLVPGTGRYPDINVLRKPYTPTELSDKVRSILDRQPPEMPTRD